MLLVTGERSGVLTYSEEAATRWRNMGRPVKLAGEDANEFALQVLDADETIGEWLDRVEAKP